VPPVVPPGATVVAAPAVVAGATVVAVDFLSEPQAAASSIKPLTSATALRERE
jgi:hypothetical protein